MTASELRAYASFNASLALTHLRMCDRMDRGAAREACHRLAQQYVQAAKQALARARMVDEIMGVPA